MDILHAYEDKSGQKVNVDKSCVFFSPNTPEAEVAKVKEVLGVETISSHEKYLGLPSLVGRSKREIFAVIRDRVCGKIKGWKEKLLSRGGREVLVKAVAQAIPTYAMSCFKLPATLLDDISKDLAKFWWGSSSDKRKIHWVSWERLCRSKSAGGLGFRNLHVFNQALLVKQVWRLMHNRESLLFKVMKARYFPRCDVLDAQIGSHPSFTWRSIWGVIGVVKLGVRWRVGDGSKIRIGLDPWIPSPPSFKPCSTLPPQVASGLVSSLMIPVSNSWNLPLIRLMFMPRDAEFICSLPIHPLAREDVRVWHFDKKGCFSVKSAYWALLNS